jgi:hypothetical protein
VGEVDGYLLTQAAASLALVMAQDKGKSWAACRRRSPARIDPRAMGQHWLFDDQGAF